jgi:DNA-binding transcriptional ArsR family regulator
MIYTLDRKVEKTLKALANGRRLAIISFLKERNEATVGDIARHINLSFKATSKHLVLLSSSELVTKEQRDLFVYYRLSPIIPPYIQSLLAIL